MCKKCIDNIGPLEGVWGIIAGVKVCKKCIDNIGPLEGVWGIIAGVKVCKKCIDNIGPLEGVWGNGFTVRNQLIKKSPCSMCEQYL